MYVRTISVGASLTAGSLHYDDARNRVLAVTDDGRILAVQLFDGAVVEIGAGYADPVGVVKLADGLRLAIAEADGTVLLVGSGAADRANAWPLATFPGQILGVAEHPDSDALLVLWYNPDTDASRLSRCDLGDGGPTTLGDVDAGRRIAVDAEFRRVTVLSVFVGDARRLTTISLDGSPDDLQDVDGYDHITAAPAGALFVTRREPTSPDGDVLALWDGTETLSEALVGRVDGITRWGSPTDSPCARTPRGTGSISATPG